MTYHSKSSTDEEFCFKIKHTLLIEGVYICVCVLVFKLWRYPKRPCQNVPSINKIKGQV